MKNESRITELLAESLKSQDRIIAQLMESNKKLGSMDMRLGNLEIRADHQDKTTDRIEGQLVKLNLQTVENTRAIFTLAEKVDQIADLHNRVTKLEKVVYK
jgi:uncharacterized coiled-coil protein SlyX